MVPNTRAGLVLGEEKGLVNVQWKKVTVEFSSSEILPPKFWSRINSVRLREPEVPEIYMSSGGSSLKLCHFIPACS